ncbi:MAG: hypothetical protein R3Y56_04570 [Akkermansia sp.]
MNTKQFLKIAALSSCCLVAACSSGDNEDVDTTIYVSERSFANGALGFKFGANLVEFIVKSNYRIANTSFPEDDDQVPVTVSGDFVVDANYNDCTFEYNVNNSIGDLTLMSFDATENNSSVMSIYTENYSNYLGLSWSQSYNKPLYTVHSMSIKFDMIRGLCQTTTSYYARTYNTTIDYDTSSTLQERVSGWNRYIITMN